MCLDSSLLLSFHKASFHGKRLRMRSTACSPGDTYDSPHHGHACQESERCWHHPATGRRWLLLDGLCGRKHFEGRQLVAVHGRHHLALVVDDHATDTLEEGWAVVAVTTVGVVDAALFGLAESTALAHGFHVCLVRCPFQRLTA